MAGTTHLGVVYFPIKFEDAVATPCKESLRARRSRSIGKGRSTYVFAVPGPAEWDSEPN